MKKKKPLDDASVASDLSFLQLGIIGHKAARWSQGKQRHERVLGFSTHGCPEKPQQVWTCSPIPCFISHSIVKLRSPRGATTCPYSIQWIPIGSPPLGNCSTKGNMRPIAYFQLNSCSIELNTVSTSQQGKNGVFLRKRSKNVNLETDLKT